MRELFFTHKDILLKLEKTERKSEKQDMEIQLIFNALKKLLQEPIKEITKIGFKINNKNK